MGTVSIIHNDNKADDDDDDDKDDEIDDRGWGSLPFIYT